jgi:hypothetical protein
VFAANQVITEAELAARGIHPVSVAHGWLGRFRLAPLGRLDLDPPDVISALA